MKKEGEREGEGGAKKRKEGGVENFEIENKMIIFKRKLRLIIICVETNLKTLLENARVWVKQQKENAVVLYLRCWLKGTIDPLYKVLTKTKFDGQ